MLGVFIRSGLKSMLEIFAGLYSELDSTKKCICLILIEVRSWSAEPMTTLDMIAYLNGGASLFVNQWLATAKAVTRLIKILSYNQQEIDKDLVSLSTGD